MNPEGQTSNPNSQSVSAGSVSRVYKIITTWGFLDEGFPMWTQIFQTTKIPYFILYPLMMVYFVQVLGASIWPWNPYWQQDVNFHFSKWQRQILYYRRVPIVFNDYLLVTGIFGILNLLSVAMIRSQINYFKFNRKFILWLNFPMRLYFEAIVLLFMLPNVVVLGETFLLLAKGNKNVSVIISFVLALGNEIYILYFYIVIQHFNAMSLFINVSPLLNFNPTFMQTVTLSSHCTVLSYFLFSLFENWSFFVTVIFCLGCCSFIAYNLINYLYIVDIIIMSSLMGFAFGCTAGNIMSVICYFQPNLSYLMPPLITIGFFMLGFVISYIYFVIRTNQIVSKLNVVFANQEQYFDYYDSIGLEDDEDKAQTYLRIGFQQCCPCFYNLTLLNYIHERFSSEKSNELCVLFSAFFPKEHRLQNKFEKKLLKRRKLNFISRFLIFQLESIKTQRQFTDNMIMRNKLMEMKNLTGQCESQSRLGLDGNTINQSYLETLATMASKTRNLWKEALLNFPNSIKMCDEYFRYLVEVECDFPEAIKIKHKAQLIESGQSYSSDHCFKSFVQAFPKYLTDKIIDFDGKIIAGNFTDKNSQNYNSFQENVNSATIHTNSSNHAKIKSKNDTDDVELENEIEEAIGKSTIKFAKERLSLHRMLQHKITMPIKMIKFVAFGVIFYILFLTNAATFLARNTVTNHIENMKELNFIAKARFYIALSSVCIMTQFFNQTGFFKNYTQKLQVYINTTSVELNPFIDFIHGDLPMDLLNFSKLSNSYFSDLMQYLSEQAHNRRNVYKYIRNLLSQNVPIRTYYNRCINFTVSNGSLTNLYSLMFTIHRTLSSYKNFLVISQDNDTCDLANNYVYFYQGTAKVYLDIAESVREDSEKIKKAFLYYSYSAPIITFFIVFLPICTIHFLTLKDEKKIKRIVQSIDQQARNESKEDLRIHSSNDEVLITETTAKSGGRVYLILLQAGWAIYYLMIVLIACFIVLHITDDLDKLNDWNQFSASRLSLSAESLNAMMNVLIIKEIPTAYKDEDKMKFYQLAMLFILKLKEAETNLISGTNRSKLCQGFDKKLDELNIIDAKMNKNASSPHEYYQYAAIHQQLDIYQSYAKIILEDVMMTNGTYSQEDGANFLFIGNYFLFRNCYLASNRIIELMDHKIVEWKSYFGILAVLVFAGILAYIMSSITYYNNRFNSYKAALFIIKRINPYTLLNNIYFNQFFLKNDEEFDTINGQKMSLEQLIITNANDSIICTNIYGVVEQVNQAVTNLLGFTREQILGQVVTSLFSSDCIEKIGMKLDQMKNHQTSSFLYEDDYVVVNNASKSLNVKCSIIGMKNSYNDNLNSFVFILKDTTKLEEQKRQAENEKMKSENLLYQILPRDIVLQINKNIKEISFNVNSATICFIDINKFSEYTTNLTPNNIMSNLSYYFSVLDQTLKEYPLLIKIKLIGDIYMAAGGIFNNDVGPEVHAEQMILFCFDVLYHLEEINKKLDSNLQIRIGINTGGPLIAGVLGTDKPLFDIIGDPINVAARLQSTSDVNKVHISGDTFELVKGLNYDITKRGETFLKGKGKQITYYISPPSHKRNSSELQNQQSQTNQ
ncbi:Adenylate and Guanylate cyclase catalytic domain containing protein [Trichomonas vaginalis G3]|uniref:Adenylate and Guanylate cyclase catalytic domain containing protein n=1 Tax=Trichomonas vaginalis (strain ATCC PRA-98 / G3) TaxID=412133 RepID=A2F3K7_TRIV3|nr:guanylate cyclase protein [Trichomonas vaginalis G3]EAY00530.1 Adenylate and Guanylate cyclase catalytic domain containing protein [Trichomonas vaginalis G3]KAI5550179.1 guanylate cyclase protein [Trichomonas vaginalis G3]|eukprot:XP_001313459.1 Adenylate and Guanylate cyclase catalytic domain containing protein [Trichomonas vaginalis G3]